MFSLLLLVVSCLNPVEARADYNPFTHLWEGLRDAPDTQNIIVFSVGSVGTLGAYRFLDNKVRNYFAGTSRLGGYEKIGTIWGSGIPEVTIGLGALAYGLLGSHPYEVDTGESLLEGLAVTALVTGGLELVTHRARPDNATNYSFPSGHASTASALGANMLDRYGARAGVPGLVMAAFTGVCRLSSNVHWLSDVIFGATLGLVFGHSYTIHHREGGTGQAVTSLSLEPYYDSASEYGLVARFDF